MNGIKPCCEIKKRTTKYFNELIEKKRALLYEPKGNETPTGGLGIMRMYKNIDYIYKELIGELLKDGCEKCKAGLDNEINVRNCGGEKKGIEREKK